MAGLGRVHDQVVHVVFGFGFQRQPIQAGDDGEPTDRRNPPWVGRRRAGPDIDPPRSEASLDATLGKHFHDEPLIAALERRTIPLADDDSRWSGRGQRGGEVFKARPADTGVAKRADRGAITGRRRLFETAQHGRDAVRGGLRRDGRGQPHQGGRQAEFRGGAEVERGHRGFHIRAPRAGHEAKGAQRDKWRGRPRQGRGSVGPPGCSR